MVCKVVGLPGPWSLMVPMALNQYGIVPVRMKVILRFSIALRENRAHSTRKVHEAPAGSLWTKRASFYFVCWNLCKA